MDGVSSYYSFLLKPVKGDKYLVQPLFQSGRHEILDQLTRFHETLWAKELIPDDLVGYHAFSIGSRQDIYQWLPIVFEIPSGYDDMGIMKAKGLKDAVFFQYFSCNGGLRFEILVINGEHAKSMLYLEAMEEGFFDGALGMLQAELD